MNTVVYTNEHCKRTLMNTVTQASTRDTVGSCTKESATWT